MATYGGPQIIRDGLVLYLDAANRKSYPTTGTVWSDLSGNSNTGTLTNGPTFNSANGGSIVFDGTNDYVQFSTVSVRTICLWGRMDSTIVDLAGLVCTSATGDGSLRALKVGSNVTFRTSGQTDTNDFQFGFESSFMINGVSNLANNGSGGFVIPNGRTLYENYYVGAVGNARNVSTISHTFMSRVYKGNIFLVCLYNRVLTNVELLQNYNAMRTRFGL
jgi:hypothetical protein